MTDRNLNFWQMGSNGEILGSIFLVIGKRPSVLSRSSLVDWSSTLRVVLVLVWLVSLWQVTVGDQLSDEVGAHHSSIRYVSLTCTTTSPSTRLREKQEAQRRAGEQLMSQTSTYKQFRGLRGFRTREDLFSNMPTSEVAGPHAQSSIRELL